MKDEPNLLDAHEFFTLQSNRNELHLLDHKEFMTLLSKTKLALELADNKHQLLHVVGDDPRALKFASPRLQDDVDVVRKAIDGLGESVQWASPRLKDNKEIAMQAVFSEPQSFKHLSERMRNDPEVAVVAAPEIGEDIGYVLGNDLKAKLGNGNFVAQLQAMESANLTYRSPEMTDAIKKSKTKALGR